MAEAPKAENSDAEPAAALAKAVDMLDAAEIPEGVRYVWVSGEIVGWCTIHKCDPTECAKRHASAGSNGEASADDASAHIRATIPPNAQE